MNSTTIVAVTGVSGIVALAAGQNHSCALKNDGSAICWGSNSNGQLGDGTMSDRLAPVAVLGGAAYWK